MKIIILGSGNVGLELAKYLVNAGHAVTIVDDISEENTLLELVNRIDLRTVTGNPASPAVLRKAGAENAELLVAVTADDEVNITACCVAAFLFKIPRKIARIRSTEYLQEASDLFGSNSIPIDHIISPEHIITDDIMAMIELAGISSIGFFFSDSVIVSSAVCTENGKLMGQTALTFEDYDGKARILAIYRNGKYLRAFKEEQLKPGDEVFFCCERDRALSQLSALRGLKTSGRNICILGGTHAADALARTLSEKYAVKLIETDPKRAERSADLLHDTAVEVFCADPMDKEFIDEEHLDRSDLFIAAGPSDESNIMSSLLLRQRYAVRTLSVIRGEGYYELSAHSQNEMETVIFPQETTISALLSHIRQEGVENVRLFRHSRSEALELKLEGTKFTSRIIGHRADSLSLPAGVTLGLVKRGLKILEPAGDLVFEDGDHIVVFLDDHRLMRKLVGFCRPRSFWIPKW